MEIREVTDMLEKKVGKNAPLFIGIGFVAVFLIAYVMQSKKESTATETVQITGAYSSYPDTVTNADEITATMQESVDYQTEELKQYVNEQLQAGMQYQTGFGDSTQIMDGLEELGQDVNSLYSKVNTLQSNIKDLDSSIMTKVSTSSTKNVSSSGSVKTSSYDEYYPKTSYKGVSIVDGLKAIGEYSDSSFANRKKIAKLNGITNYTGTASQNTELLNKLKAGTLKRI